MAEFVVILSFAAAVGALLLAARLCIQYQLGSRHLLILWLGMPIRRIPFKVIDSIGTKPVFWTENWSNTPNSKGKRLVLRLQQGLLRQIVITPAHPYVFRTQLERARRASESTGRNPVRTGDTEVVLTRATAAACL